MNLFGTFILSLSVSCWGLPIVPFQETILPVNLAINSEANVKTLGGFPDSGRKYAVREEKSQESLPIQLDNKYGKAQSFIAGIYNPKPIVDSIQEYEKYGNDGSQHNKIGNAIVNGYEAFSNIVNAAAEFPFEVIRQVGRKASTSLNAVGGKIVGLS